ncbi:hypothetical protein EI555_018274, partial [Monodon monoceros]
VGSTPFPSLAPPITLLVDGKQQTLVVCLVLDVAPPGLESPIWFSAGNGSSLDAFTYGPSPAADGTWTSLAQLSLPSEDLAAWETLVCHTGPGTGDHSQSTQPLQLSGEASSARTCLWEPLRASRPLTGSFSPAGTRGQALRLEALRLLLFKLLLLDVLLTCSRFRAPPAVRGYPARAPRPGDPGLPAAPWADHLLLPQPPPPGGSSADPTDWIRRNDSPRAQPVHPAGAAAPGRPLGSHPPSGSGSQEPCLGGGGRWCSGRGDRDPPSVFLPPALEHFSAICLLQLTRASPEARLRLPPQTDGFLREKALSLPSDWKSLEGGD